MKKLFVQFLSLAATAFVGNAIEPHKLTLIDLNLCPVKTAGSPVVIYLIETQYFSNGR